MRKHKRRLGKFPDDVIDFFVLGMNVENHPEFDDVLDQQFELLDRVLVRDHIVAQLAHPDKPELLAAVVDFLQSFVDELRIDYAGAFETPFVLLHEAGDLAVAGDELGGVPFCWQR